MNSQLCAHLEAFESRDDGNHDCSSSSENSVKATGDDGNNNAEVDTWNEEIDSFQAGSATIFSPIIFASLLALHRGVEVIASLSIVVLSFTCLVLWQQQYSTDLLLHAQQKISQHINTSLKSMEKKSSTRKNLLPQLSALSDKNAKSMEAEIYDCRNEICRLLGLIGAPPIGVGNSFDEQGDEHLDADSVSNNIQILEKLNNHTGVSISTVAASIVSFLEAHVQVLLTIDKAFHWIKISSSLHWGLGPHSQSVERVERAAMSKNLFATQRKSLDRSDNRMTCVAEKDNITTQPLTRTSSRVRISQPQSNFDSSSILALSSARRNIAHIIINEARSIMKVLRTVDLYVGQQRQWLSDRFDDQNGDDNCMEANGREYFKNDYLEMPVVVDIAWIKASRKHLANLLSYTSELFFSRGSFAIISSLGDSNHLAPLMTPIDPLQILKESMQNARDFRDYLMSHILLEDESHSSMSRLRSIRSDIYSGELDSENDFILPLFEYQKQLDALDVALWSFQQYIYSQNIDSSNSNDSGDRRTKENNEISGQQGCYRTKDLRSSSAKLAWWNQFKEISATCQSLEKEIGNRFFSNSDLKTATNSLDSSSDECSISSSSNNIANETQSYEHTEDQKLPDNKNIKNTPSMPSKTLVFSGEGSREKQSMNNKKGRLNIDDSGTTNLILKSGSTAMPPPSARDTFAEQLLVKELQNRIRAVAALREEEQVNLSQDKCQAACQEDEDQSSQRMTTDAGFEDMYSRESIVAGHSTSVENNEIGSRKRAVTTSMFLGASGSLLDELKLNICPGEVKGDHEIHHGS